MKPRSRYRGLTMFVTVGSTKFDQMIQKLLNDESVDQMIELGFSRLIIQTGCSRYMLGQVHRLRERHSHNLEIEIFDYKPSIHEDIKQADLVVGHAGAGTCLEVLRSNKRLLIVVNNSLMDNHQSELASQLSEDGFAIQTTVDKLNEDLAAICNGETKLSKFPPRQPDKFEEIFDEALRKVTSRL